MKKNGSFISFSTIVLMILQISCALVHRRDILVEKKQAEIVQVPPIVEAKVSSIKKLILCSLTSQLFRQIICVVNAILFPGTPM